MNRREIEQELASSVLRAYTRSIFGKVAKAELDLPAFSAVVKLEFLSSSDLWRSDGSFNWMRLDVSHISSLSFALSLTPARIVSSIQQCALLERSAELSPKLVLDEMNYLLGRSQQNPKDLTQGILRLYVPNRLTRQSLECFLASKGGTPDASFHRDHLLIPFGDLLRVLSAHDEDASDGNRPQAPVPFITRLINDVKDGADTDQVKQLIILASEPNADERFGSIARLLLSWIAAGSIKWSLPQLLDHLKSCW
ncbi:hypothetical protein KUL97_01345 [Synechococcus sp. HK05]|uniref:hypothetical protein n=1 Tax=Synechococcus sp. HK05 TaxID=2725975 RepID=UPI001C3831AB|nr:hypothetical protein [Synechococcus sp. HK05]MBV2350347.1 hypothetical protein [Synechococcus sp. HK05]